MNNNLLYNQINDRVRLQVGYQIYYQVRIPIGKATDRVINKLHGHIWSETCGLISTQVRTDSMYE